MKRKTLSKTERERYVRAYKKWSRGQREFMAALDRVEELLGKEAAWAETKRIERELFW